MGNIQDFIITILYGALGLLLMVVGNWCKLIIKEGIEHLKSINLSVGSINDRISKLDVWQATTDSDIKYIKEDIKEIKDEIKTIKKLNS